MNFENGFRPIGDQAGNVPVVSDQPVIPVDELREMGGRRFWGPFLGKAKIRSATRHKQHMALILPGGNPDRCQSLIGSFKS